MISDEGFLLYIHLTAEVTGIPRPGSKPDPESACQQSSQNSANVKNQRKLNVFSGPAAVAEQDKQADSGTYEQSGDHRTGTHAAFQIELGDHHRCCAIRNQTNKSCCKLSCDQPVQKQASQRILSHQTDHDIHQHRRDSQKKNDINCMLQRRADDSFFLTAAVIMFTKIMNTGTDPALIETAEQKVDRKTGPSSKRDRFRE